MKFIKFLFSFLFHLTTRRDWHVYRQEKRRWKNFFLKKHGFSVLLVLHDLTVTGAPIACLQLAKAIQNKGGSVSLVAFAGGALKEGFEAINITPIYGNNYIKNKFIIRNLCENFDFIILNTIICYTWAMHIGKNKKAYWWIHESGFIDTYIQSLNEESNTCIDSIKHFKNIFSVSEYAREYLSKYTKNIKILNLGIGDAYEQTAKTIGGKVIFSVIGTYDTNKGQQIMLEAILALEKTYRRQAEFRFIGKQQGAVYSEFAAKAKNENSVYLFDEIADQKSKWLMYAETDVVCVPSFAESCSLVVLEACMMGKPVVLTHTNGAKYMISNFDNGIIINPGNVNELAYCLRWCIDNKEKLLCMGEKSRKKYLEYASLEHLSNQIMNIFHKNT